MPKRLSWLKLRATIVGKSEYTANAKVYKNESASNQPQYTSFFFGCPVGLRVRGI